MFVCRTSSPRASYQNNNSKKCIAKRDTKDLDSIKGPIFFDKGDELKRETRWSPSRTLARLNKQPHRSQFGNKMIKGEGDNMGKAEDMGVIGS